MRVLIEESKLSKCRSIIEVFNLVAESAGIVVDEESIYDCRKIFVGNGVINHLRTMYLERGLSKESYTKDMCCFGPKYCKELADLEVTIEDDFVRRSVYA